MRGNGLPATLAGLLALRTRPGHDPGVADAAGAKRWGPAVLPGLAAASGAGLGLATNVATGLLPDRPKQHVAPIWVGTAALFLVTAGLAVVAARATSTGEATGGRRG